MILSLSRRDIFRPIFGFVAVQPALILFFLVMSDDWWSDYLAIGWPMNLLITIWLIPCYALYERFWNRREQRSYSQSAS